MRAKICSSTRPTDILIVLVFACVSCSPCWGRHPEPVFAAPFFLTPNHGVIAVEAADIDNDGDSDVVVPSLTGLISIFRNLGGGDFAEVQTYAAPGVHLDFVVSDLNGDGLRDVALALFGNSGVQVLLNQGGGVLSAAINYAAPGISAGRGLAAGDLDNDGDTDLLMGDASVSVKAVLSNNGAGVFDQSTSFGAGGDCIALAIGDLDNDGDEDAVSAFGGLWVHHNNGNASFAPAQQVASGTSHTSLAIADLDADGDNDIAASVSSEKSANVAKILLNSGDGVTFTAAVYPINALARDIALGDLDNDGDLDVVTSHVSSVDRVSVLLNQGDGTLGLAAEIFPGTYPQSLAIADFNADGLKDLVTANQFAKPPSLGVLLSEIPTPLLGDVNGDGTVDVDDLIAVILAWGQCPTPPATGGCPADVNHSGTVDVDDLIMVILNWG